MIIFRYKSEKGAHQHLVKRPVAEVWLKNGQEKIKLHSYIDSGADVTLIPFSLGELLGFKADKEKTEHLGGISDGVSVIYKRCQIKIGNCLFPILVAWALSEDVPVLLGRAGVFDTFDITFKQKEGKIIFMER
jgi:hypothetical protein